MKQQERHYGLTDAFYDNSMKHHGILGQKWGIRRFQNPDGSLTPAGRERLGITKYQKDHSDDIVLKKGTVVNRVISTQNTYYYSQRGHDALKKYLDDKINKDISFERKYVSADGVRDPNGRWNGEEYYLSWFTNNGWDPTAAQVAWYQLQTDVHVASGKQVLDEVIKEYGETKISDLLNDKFSSVKSITLDYTRDKEVFNRVNQRFLERGYDAIEDINDQETDMPLIFLNSSKTLGHPTSVESGVKAIERIKKKYEAQNK